MQENKRSNKQNEKTKDNVVQASKIKVDERNNIKQASKVKIEVQDKKKIAVLVAIIATILVIGILGMTAYARYRSKIEGQGTALVAAWSFKVNGSTESIASFDLGTTRSDVNGKVADGVIAPGTSGSFDIEIDGSGSEVAIDYIIEVDVSAKPTNLKFYRNSDFTDEITIGENSILNIEGFIDLEKVNTKVREKIYWNWPYRTGETEEEKLANDKIDSQEMEKTIEMPIKVIGRQSNLSSNNLLQSTIEIIGPSSGTYKQGQKIIVQVNYNNNIYGGANKVAINESSAPELKIKLGNGEAKQASYSLSKENYIQYTYTLEEYDYGSLRIVSYLGNVYNENGEKLEVKTKELSGNSIVANCAKTLADVVSVGDKVNYKASSGNGIGKSYTTDSSLTGTSTGAGTTFSSSEEMTWKVMSVDKATGTVELMAENPTANKVSLYGKTGYKNAETILNDIGKVYGYGDGATGGRSITIEDVNKLENYTPEDDTTTSIKYTSGTFINEDGTETVATTDNPVTMGYTASTPEKSTNKGGYTYLTTNFSGKTIWLASRCIILSEDICHFFVRRVLTGEVYDTGLLRSTGNEYGNNMAVVPVVSLKSKIQTSGQNEERKMGFNSRIKLEVVSCKYVAKRLVIDK